MIRPFKARGEQSASRRRPRVATLGAAAAVALGLVVVPSTPASAATSTSVTMTGTMSIVGSTWALGSAVCVIEEASTVTAAPAGADPCAVNSYGNTYGTCPLDAGHGTMWLTKIPLLAPHSLAVQADFHYQRTGTTMTFTGTAVHQETGQVGSLVGAAVLGNSQPAPCGSGGREVINIELATLNFLF